MWSLACQPFLLLETWKKISTQDAYGSFSFNLQRLTALIGIVILLTYTLYAKINKPRQSSEKGPNVLLLCIRGKAEDEQGREGRHSGR